MGYSLIPNPPCDPPNETLEAYVGRMVEQIRHHKTADGDRLVISFLGTENYLDIRAEELFVAQSIPGGYNHIEIGSTDERSDN